MKQPSRGFLEDVTEHGDPELEQLFAGARELAEPSLGNRERVSQALRAALPQALVPHQLPSERVGAGPNASWWGGPALLGQSLRGGGAARATGKWLLLGGALIGASGFWLGHVVGYADAERARASTQLPGSTLGRAETAGGTALGEHGAALAGVEPDAARESVRQGAAPTPELLSSDTSEPPELSRPKASPARKPSPAVEHAPAQADVNFREVLDQLRRAEQHLRSGQSTVSLLLLSELDRHAGDVLWEERETARILALCASGQERRARSAASALRQRNRETIYAMRLDESCASQNVDAD